MLPRTIEEYEADFIKTKHLLLDISLPEVEFKKKTRFLKLASEDSLSSRAYLEKNILSILQSVDEIRKQSKKNFSKHPKIYQHDLKKLTNFLNATYRCIDEVILIKKRGGGERKVNERLLEYLHESATYRAASKRVWRNLTRPVLLLCRNIAVNFKYSLSSVGLFAKERPMNYRTWTDLADKSNKLTHVLLRMTL